MYKEANFLMTKEYAIEIVQKEYSIQKIVSCDIFHKTYGLSNYTEFNNFCNPSGVPVYIFYGNVNKSMQLNFDPNSQYSGGIVSMFRKFPSTQNINFIGEDTFGKKYDTAIAGSQPPNGYEIINHVNFGIIVSKILPELTFLPLGFNYAFDGFILKIS